MDFAAVGFDFWGTPVKAYPLTDDLLAPVRRAALPRLPRDASQIADEVVQHLVEHNRAEVEVHLGIIAECGLGNGIEQDSSDGDGCGRTACAVSMRRC